MATSESHQVRNSHAHRQVHCGTLSRCRATRWGAVTSSVSRARRRYGPRPQARDKPLVPVVQTSSVQAGQAAGRTRDNPGGHPVPVVPAPIRGGTGRGRLHQTAILSLVPERGPRNYPSGPLRSDNRPGLGAPAGGRVSGYRRQKRPCPRRCRPSGAGSTLPLSPLATRRSREPSGRSGSGRTEAWCLTNGDLEAPNVANPWTPNGASRLGRGSVRHWVGPVATEATDFPGAPKGC